MTPPDDDDPVVLPKDQGTRAFRWLLGFGGWMGVAVGGVLWFGTNITKSPVFIISIFPMVAFFGGMIAIAFSRRWREPGDDDF